MAKPGPKPRPPLQVVREGNPGKRAVLEGVKLPPVEGLSEPDWMAWFPQTRVPARPRAPRGADDAELAAFRVEVAAWQRIKVAIEASNRCRATARAEWTRVVPVLIRSAGLAEVDLAVVTDYCVTVARLVECELRLSIEGLVVMGQRGTCRNPLTTVASQYRTQLKTYIGEFGLSPSARGRLEPPGGDDGENDPFD